MPRGPVGARGGPWEPVGDPWVAVGLPWGSRGAPVGFPSVRSTVRPSKNKKKKSKSIKHNFSSIIDEVISWRNPILIFPELIYIEKS